MARWALYRPRRRACWVCTYGAGARPGEGARTPMTAKLNLLTAEGTYGLYQVASLGNQAAVIDGSAVFVATTGSRGQDIGIALAALGAVLDLGLLAWPALGFGYDWDKS